MTHSRSSCCDATCCRIVRVGLEFSVLLRCHLLPYCKIRFGILRLAVMPLVAVLSESVWNSPSCCDATCCCIVRVGLEFSVLLRCHLLPYCQSRFGILRLAAMPLVAVLSESVWNSPSCCDATCCHIVRVGLEFFVLHAGKSIKIRQTEDLIPVSQTSQNKEYKIHEMGSI